MSGALKGPLDNAETLIANSSTFQTWTGAANATAAKAFIHLQVEDESNISRDSNGNLTKPYTLVEIIPGFTAEAIATGLTYSPSGQLNVYFMAPIASGEQAEASVATAFTSFWTNVDGVIDDIIGIAGTDAYLNVTTIRLEEGPHKNDEDERRTKGHYFWVQFVFDWGV